MSNENSISLNKYISDTGRCSRREADKLIAAGKVLLNGVVAKTGNRVFPEDIVIVDGHKIKKENLPQIVYLAFNKPRGIICTTDQSIKDNIIDYIRYPERIFPIGRLDVPSEGLIFLTNDGNIVNKILRAGNQHEKEYIVKVNKEITPEFLRKMSSGIPILDTITNPCKVEQINPTTFKIILTQGLNRQIRRMCEFLKYDVIALQRIRIMNIKLDNLKPGQWRNLTKKEIEILNSLVKDSKKTN
jgi:23S rRNA pseudouridine2604 synthase